MPYPELPEFLELAKKGNLIPVYEEILADLETPVSAYFKINDGDYSFLLESVEGGERTARFSFLGSNPSLIFKSKNRTIEIIENKTKNSFTTSTDPLSEIKKIMQDFKFVNVKGLPRFSGGLVGFFGYDMVRFFENIPDKNKDDINCPDGVFMLTDTILIFDHIKHTIKVVSNAHIKGSPKKSYEDAVIKINLLVKKLKKSVVSPGITIGKTKTGESFSFESNVTKNEFINSVKSAKEYIKKGDVIQIVPSQRFKIKLKKRSTFGIYRALRSINPSPYMYYLKLKDFDIIGSSPELFVRCEDGVVETRPIAGTRKRGADENEDLNLAKDLLSDPKERAEHIMLVDLGRNDIGRVCDFKTIHVDQFMTIEKYSHVMHIVSSVKGKLSKGKDSFDVIRACFPAGTVTGAPKIRAMEIIDELENTRRGIYAGSVGYFSFSGNFDSCITIRTILVKNNAAYIQAGAGIVLDSVPINEFKETVNKAKALFAAIEISEKGSI